MSQQVTTAPVAARKPRRLRRFIFPAFLLLIIVAMFLVPTVGQRLDIDANVLMKMMMITS